MGEESKYGILIKKHSKQFSNIKIIYLVLYILQTNVESRNFGISIDNTNRVAMVPVSDLLNHDKNPDVSWHFNQKSRSFKMLSNRYLKKGKAITDSYGKKSNINYLLFYGFTLENNTNNNVLYINIVHTKDNIELKNYIMKNVKGYLNVDTNSTIFHDILLFFRVSLSSSDTLKSNKIISYYQEPTSIDNEKMVINAFIIYLNTLLKNYKYFNKNSINTFEQYSVSWNIYNLIMSEINIILFYIEYLNNIRRFMEGDNVIVKKKYDIYYNMIENII